MEHSQLVRSYKVFQSQVEAPFEHVKTLSNGDLIGKCYESIKDAMTQKEIISYIEKNHVENELI
jgi:hypothetical protein